MARVENKTIHVIMMTMVSGCADAIGFLALGQVLVAAMTGNTVFLGLAVVQASGLQPAGYIVALLGFMLGAAVGAFMLRKYRTVTGVNPMVTKSLGVQWIALVLFGVIAAIAAAQPSSHALTGLSNAADLAALHYSVVANLTLRLLLISLLTFGMGIQGAVARRVGVNGVPTTVITSLTTGLMESLVWNACGPITPPKHGTAAAAVKSGRGVEGLASVAAQPITNAAPVEEEAAAAREREGAVDRAQKPAPQQRQPVELHTPPRMIAVWIVDILIYGFGAASCGALVLRWHLQAVWLPVAVVSALIVYSFTTQTRRRSKPAS